MAPLCPDNSSSDSEEQQACGAEHKEIKTPKILHRTKRKEEKVGSWDTAEVKI